MITKLTTKEIRNMLFDPEFFGLTAVDEELLGIELFERTGEEPS